MMVSGGQQMDLAIHIHGSITPKLLSRLAHNNEQGSLCYTVGPLLVIQLVYSSVYMLIPNSLTIPSSHPSRTWQP